MKKHSRLTIGLALLFLVLFVAITWAYQAKSPLMVGVFNFYCGGVFVFLAQSFFYDRKMNAVAQELEEDQGEEED